MSDRRLSQSELIVSWATLLKILLACLLAVVLFKLWSLLELLFLALLVAITLWPLLEWTTKRGLPKWVGVTLTSLVLVCFVVLFLGLLIPAISSQGSAIIESLPRFKENFMGKLPGSGPVRDLANRTMDLASFSDPQPLMKSFITWGSAALQGLVQFFVVLIVAVYLLLDGPRVYQWLLAFFPPKHRKKMAIAAPEIAGVVSSYMAGQFITSLLCALYVFALLSLLHVPNALILAVLAGIFDVLPIIGFFLSVLPATAMALTVSPATALLVVALYLAYHLVESYFIVPTVYGNRLRLSTLTVLVSCMAGGLLAGVIGAIAILPLVASYPIVERIWLHSRLEPDTVSKHEAIDEREHPST